MLILNRYIAVYPNPFKDFVTIEAETNSGNLIVEIFSMEGRRVYQSTESPIKGINLDVSYLKNGLYIIRIVDSDGKMILNRKIIKQ
jgi:hypothetical protein